MQAFRHAARRSFRTAAVARKAEGMSIVNADSSNASFSLYHKTSLALIAATPFAIALSNSTVGTAIDVAMGLAIPIHAHIGMNWVLTDYGPKLVGAGGTQGARVVMVGLTAVATLGMLKLNLTGDGLTETVKAMWRPQKVQA